MVSASLSRAGPEPRRVLARWAFPALMMGLAGALIVPHTITVAVLAAGSLAVIVSFVRSFWWSFGPGPR
ncbi:MAG: hypothetical protein JKY37_01095 [Nannocystaceae bacterium]|nr:hypothetical protein [Nannocystaceae bacterium]